MTEDASTLTNSPVTSGGFWARRTVYPVSNPTGSQHITVELEEYEPVLGRPVAAHLLRRHRQVEREMGGDQPGLPAGSDGVRFVREHQ